jgi:ATP-binding cassette subfamily B protein
MFNRALSSAQRIFDILDTEPTQKEAKNPIKFNQLEGKIEFKQVGFSYDGVRDVLKDVSLTIEPREMIGLVGVSGSGKTTITKLIARYFDITKGQIKIDGVDINTLDIGSFRNHIGIVSQEPYLFHGTVTDNIAYGIEDASRKDIIESARKANAHNFIMRLPNGYDTMVGERGQTLSGGERQRIAIARAILKNPKILILDEATSAVDTETERKIQSAIDNLIKDKTVIAIAHRLSTLAKASRLLVMEKGELIEQGPQEELLKKEDGQYAKLYNLQQENNEYLTMQ